MMTAEECILTRRSTRKYLRKPVEEELLSRVLEAGRHAPSGGNNQTTRLIVIKNREVLDDLAAQVKHEFSQMEATEGMYSSMAAAVRASKGERYVFHFDAPVLIVAANRKNYGNNMADCACVLENMMIMANALNLGSCWINQLRWLNENGAILRKMRELGMAEDERVYGAVALGYPDTEDGLPVRTPLARTGNPVTVIE